MAKYGHDKVVPDQHSRLGKKEQVATMFDNIAHRYDFLNRFLSVGIDTLWRRRAIGELRALRPQRVLDVATGTADVAIMTQRMLKPEHITGIDISEKMLAVGRQKLAKAGLEKHITLQRGDSETINFPDHTFDAITVAFGVRNFENLEKGLAEMYRVLKPGGKLVVLEFSKPVLPVVKQLYHLYMHVLAPRFGQLFANNKKAYKYLTHSVQAFPERHAFQKILNQAGFRDTYFKSLSLGICCIYCGSK